MADVASSLKSWSTTLSSNNPASSTTVGTGLAPNLQQIQATLRYELGTRSAAITAAATTDLSTKDEGIVLVSNSAGTVAITSFGTLSAGMHKLVTFSVTGGSLSITYNATSMILPSAANITVADGDSLYAESLGSGNWKVHIYQKSAGYALAGPNSDIASLNAAVVNELQGANIASAATINLTTATGNYVSVTGTTTITAITLTQGAERTVEFAGALTLTNGASLILPGAGNILTAAGDCAKFRGEAAGVVRCVSYVRGGLPSMVQLNTANGYGSTNTVIRRFTNIVTNQGADITYADSATLGATFTINNNGVYAISYNDQFSAGDYLGVSINSSQLTTAINAISVGAILTVGRTGVANAPDQVATTMYLTAGSVLRAHTGGSASGTNTTLCQFTITSVA